MHSPEALTREVQPVRSWRQRVPWRAIALGLCWMVSLAGVVGTLVWFAMPWGGREDVAAAVPAAAVPDEVPDAVRASDEPIGEPVGELVPGAGDGWRGVAVAPDWYGVIALWTEREVWLSRDDGRTFAQVLAAPEPVAAAAVGGEARVWVARHGGRIGALSPGGRATWTDLGYDQALALAVSGARIALLALHRDRDAGLAPLLWTSEDHGHSWNAVVAPAHGDRGNLLRIAPDGAVDLLVRRTSEVCDAAAHIEHYRGNAVTGRFLRIDAREEPQPFALSHDGRALALAWGEERSVVTPLGIEVHDWDLVAGSGPDRTLLVADGRLLELDAVNQIRAATQPLPGRPDALAGDALERTAAIIGRHAVRHSPVHGWRRLMAAPPDGQVSLHGE
jgi:hypothetical protein